ncbi:MAG: PEFG-CTERM sorting domain-containing protein [Crenarchaeota archaeon]|nr:MAG: PEFG-CTERM sorting domain-containing protein [Thermoproteota archaeon]RDJ33573.1 MAG: PEFG-CTERM sorting domain-containing protein [Thermoproteota archaeon]RDJ38105.1 MAG: PEFG-CTERM sorting domain-containing protein [Thermoproteota archaeon]RDJ39126.1 MAG: PEFG-CTERM sorting domain-containing protein [Thermoproteota archaeon]
MSTRLSVLALSAILVASIGLTPAFGQIVEPIRVSTDLPSYSDGDTVIISGEVKELLSGFPVTLQVISANGNLVTVKQLDVGTDKKFGTELTAGGALWKSKGTYTVKVLYGTESRTAEATFEFGGSTGQPGTKPTGPTIQVGEFAIGYSITGGSLLSITPDEESKSLILEISTTGDGQLTINLPRAVIDAKLGGCSGEDDDFFVLIDGQEEDFDEVLTSDMRTLTISFLEGSEVIEIIGTCVIPEFGAIAALILAVAIISIIAVSARSRLSIMPKY